MKSLVLVVVLAAACLALPQRRPNPQEFQGQPEDSYREDRQQDRPHQQQQDRPHQQHQQHAQQQQQQQDQPRHRESTTFIPIIRFDKEQGNDGSYKASWETANDILASEEGFLKELGPDPDAEGEVLHAQVQQGSYTYTAPDGQVITVNYVADERGFHPSGDHLPTPPPVSPEVQKGLDLIFAGIKAQEEEDARNPPQQQQQNRHQN